MDKKVFVVSLGCPKNLVDTEVMLGLLEEAGYASTEAAEEADLLLVNTCGFIQPAVEEGIDEILAVAALKESDPAKKLVVTGCMVQRYGVELAKEFPEIDLCVGTESINDLPALLARLEQSDPCTVVASEDQFLMNSALPRRLSAPAHHAYMKVTEGCANRCAYCLIPSIRGTLRSRELPDLLSEAKNLDAVGVKEVNLVAQDLTAYGHDFGPDRERLPDLLQVLIDSTAIPWFRLLYLYPVRVKEPLLRFVAGNPRIVPYLDIPLQHVSDRILKAMNRPYGFDLVEELLGQIRSILPQAAIRTTFMVGFPGEREEDVSLIEKVMREYRLEHVGIFGYSNEEGCAAYNLENQCSDEEKEARKSHLLSLQREISLEKNKGLVGSIQDVLVEGPSKETDLLLEGRTRFQAPEIDGCVYINAGQCNPGDIVQVKITEAHPYDLVGEIVEGG